MTSTKSKHKLLAPIAAIAVIAIIFNSIAPAHGFWGGFGGGGFLGSGGLYNHNFNNLYGNTNDMSSNVSSYDPYNRWSSGGTSSSDTDAFGRYNNAWSNADNTFNDPYGYNTRNNNNNRNNDMNSWFNNWNNNGWNNNNHNSNSGNPYGSNGSSYGYNTGSTSHYNSGYGHSNRHVVSARGAPDASWNKIEIPSSPSATTLDHSPLETNYDEHLIPSSHRRRRRLVTFSMPTSDVRYDDDDEHPIDDSGYGDLYEDDSMVDDEHHPRSSVVLVQTAPPEAVPPWVHASASEATASRPSSPPPPSPSPPPMLVINHIIHETCFIDNKEKEKFLEAVSRAHSHPVESVEDMDTDQDAAEHDGQNQGSGNLDDIFVDCIRSHTIIPTPGLFFDLPNHHDENITQPADVHGRPPTITPEPPVLLSESGETAEHNILDGEEYERDGIDITDENDDEPLHPPVCGRRPRLPRRSCSSTPFDM